MEKIFELVGDESISKIIFENSTKNRLRSLIYNLKKFPHLKEQLRSKDLDPVYFSKHMDHTEMLPKDENKKEDYKLSISDGMMKCENCNSMKTNCSEMHNIEFTVVFVNCYECGHTSRL